MKKTASIFKNSQEKIKFYKDCFSTKESIENGIFKKIQEFSESKYDPGMFCRYLAMHRALQLMYQHLHWITAGDSFYSDHLLYERLYKKMTEEIDEVAEKFVGLSGSDSVCPIKTTRVCSELLSAFYKNFNTNSDSNTFAAYALLCIAVYSLMRFLNASLIANLSLKIKRPFSSVPSIDLSSFVSIVGASALSFVRSKRAGMGGSPSLHSFAAT